MTKAAVLIADGTEEMEAVIIIDTMRRAEIPVKAVGVSGPVAVCSRGVHIQTDDVFSNVNIDSFDVLIIPGGAGGTQAMIASQEVLSAVSAFSKAGRLVCAICAGPLVLEAAGILGGRKFTCHPAVKDDFRDGDYTGSRVELDDNILTSQGPGTAFEFALRIIEIQNGAEAAASVRDGLVL